MPDLPPGRRLALPGRGTTFIRELPGPAGAPVVFLLHGWTATADLNFFTCYSALSRHFRVVAIDHRGHGRGIRTARPFRLSDCADDVVAVADQLGIGTFVPVGYSMGGTVAQLTWKRHRDRVRGLVLCATSGYFAEHTLEKRRFALLTTIMHASRVTPKPVRDLISDRLFVSRKTMVWEKWAVDEVARHEWRHILEAGAALGRYDARGWLGTVDVPTSVVINDSDRVVVTRRQRELAAAIPGARSWDVHGDHDSVWANSGSFVPALLQACAHAAGTAISV